MSTRPPWVAAAYAGAAWAGSTAGALAVVLVLALSGIDRGGPGAVLAAVLAGAAAALAGVVLVARATGDVALEPAGLRLPRPRVGLAAFVIGAVAALALGLLAAALSGAFADPSIPSELSAQTPYDRLSGALDLTRVDPGPAAVASILARAVIAIATADVILRGFIAPVLRDWLGAPAALAVVALALGAAVGSMAGGLLLAGVLLALLVGWLQAEVRSLLPGTAVLCGAAGAAMAAGMDWSPGEVALTGLLCGAAGAALLLPVALRGAGVPDGPTPVWDLRPGRG